MRSTFEAYTLFDYSSKLCIIDVQMKILYTRSRFGEYNRILRSHQIG